LAKIAKYVWPFSLLPQTRVTVDNLAFTRASPNLVRALRLLQPIPMMKSGRFQDQNGPDFKGNRNPAIATIGMPQHGITNSFEDDNPHQETRLLGIGSRYLGVRLVAKREKEVKINV
jgi:hypothetical protein